jgi:hypothetical protein
MITYSGIEDCAEDDDPAVDLASYEVAMELAKRKGWC